MTRGRTIDLSMVRNVFQSREKGKTFQEIGAFFGHTKQWAEQIFENYCPTTYTPLSEEKRGKKRKSDLLKDIGIMNVAKSMRTATMEEVRQVVLEKGLLWRDVSDSTIKAVFVILVEGQ